MIRISTKLLAGIALFSLAASGYAGCITGSYASDGWNGTITLKNTCSTAASFKDPVLDFDFSGAAIKNVWGNFGPIGWFAWQIQQSQSHYHLTGALPAWSQTTTLSAGATVTVQFSTTPTTPAASNIVFSNGGNPPPPTTGEVDLSDGAMPSGYNAGSYPVVTMNGQTYTFTDWNQTLPVTGLTNGTYTVTKVSSLTDKSGNTYQGTASPSSVTLSGNSEKVSINIAYGAPIPPTPGYIQFSVNGVSQAVNVTVGTQLYAVSNGAKLSFNPGDYTVTAATLNGFKVSVSLPQITVISDGTAQETINYQPIVLGKVDLNLPYPLVSGQPLQNAPTQQITFTDTSVTPNTNKTISYPFSNQPITINNDPFFVVGDNYKVTAPNFNFNNQNFVPTYTPVSFALTQASQTVTVAYNGSAVPVNTPKFVGYFETWMDNPGRSAAASQLANLPDYVNVVMLSFMYPNPQYKPGSYDLSGTGIGYVDGAAAGGQTLKQAIALLKAAHPNTKILISVGGATYAGMWSSFNQTDANNIAAFVKDYGLDGVDIDYEADQQCTISGNTVNCPGDANYEAVVEALRAALPRPAMLTAAVWSVGAYGLGPWAGAQPMAPRTGMSINMLQKDGNLLDMIEVMSYDAGTSYNPNQTYDAYRNYYKGPLTMGIEVPPEAWGGHVSTIDQVNSLTQYQAGNGGQGMMLWAIQIEHSNPTPGNPDAQLMATAVCSALALSSNCNQPMIPPPPSGPGSATIKMQAAPATALPVQSVVLKDQSTGQSTTTPAPWGQSVQVSNLTIGDTYTITVPAFSDNHIGYTPTAPASITIINGTNAIAVSYTAVPMSRASVKFAISGLPAGANNTDVTITESGYNPEVHSGLANGSYTFSEYAPDQYTVGAPAVKAGNIMYTASVNPATFTLTSSGATVTVSYAASHPSFMAYAATSSQAGGTVQATASGTALTEAYLIGKNGHLGFWEFDQGSAVAQAIQQQPLVYASIGGPNSPLPWYTETASQAYTDLVGVISYYHLQGVDFDLEDPASAATPAIQQWIANLAAQLRANYPNLTISLTVSDDPAGLSSNTVAIIRAATAANNASLPFTFVNKLITAGSCGGQAMSASCWSNSATLGANALASALGISVGQAYAYIGETFNVADLNSTLVQQGAQALMGQGVVHMGYRALSNDVNLQYGKQFAQILGLQ